MNCDVLIVGAGPAGTAAAYDLARAGVSTALLDKREFPRLKPCAGGVTVKSLQALRYDITPVLRELCCELRLGLRLERHELLNCHYPVAGMTVREELDPFSLQQACAVGAEFATIGRITAISRRADGWRLQTAERTFDCRHLIGADGANSRVRELLGLAPQVRFGVALETCLPVPDTAPYPMAFDFGYVPRGYAWVFPKGDHLNVGIYSLDPLPGARGHLQRYVAERLDLPMAGPIHGHRIPYGGHAFAHRPEMPLLAGDAAGLIDPLLGEGIYNALRSGQLAARAVREQLAGGPDRYDSLLREVTGDLQAYWRETQRFYSDIDRGYRHLTLPPVRYMLMKGFALGYPPGSIKRRAALLPFRTPTYNPPPHL